MRRIALIFVLSMVIFISACSSKGVVSNSAHIRNYNYATLADAMSYGGSAELMDVEIRIYDALTTTRLQVMGDRQIDSLTNDQKQQLLLVRYAASQDTYGSGVSINFIDYLTGVPIASFSGRSGSGSAHEDDMIMAVDEAIDQMKKAL